MATKVASETKTKLTPLGDRLVVKPSAREEMTKSGIVLPDTVKERPQEGTILAVGPGRTLDDGTGADRGLRRERSCSRSTPGPSSLDDEDLLILSQKDVPAVIQ
jgi:chaperonin GroES